MALRIITSKSKMVYRMCLRKSLKNTSNWLSDTESVYKLHKSTKPEDVGQTTILIEEGTDIQELPVIVRKVKSDNSLLFCENKFDENQDSDEKISKKLDDPLNDVEVFETIEGFKRCYTTRGIFALLETMPSNEVTPFISLQAFKKIINLENNRRFRNQMSKYNEDLHPNETFTRAAILNQLVDKIISSEDPNVIITGLQLVSRDMLGTDTEVYKQKLCVEVLCRVTDAKFNIEQTCEAVKIFSSFGRPNSDVREIDKLWVGISQKSSEINEKNIMNVFRCLPYFKKSRKLILNIVEKKLLQVWWHMTGNNVSEILLILREIRSFSPRILEVLGRWTNTNIHTVSEDDLLEIINGFYVLDYTNTGIENALERYIKAKGVRIKNPVLLSNVMDYCYKFRIRSVHLLQGSAEYIVTHGKHLSPVLLKSLFLPLGYLNYQPSNGLLFWQVLESAVDEKFIQFRPEDMIEMLLTCIYLQKYPLNFVKKIFNPHFLDRLHSWRDIEALNIARMKLKLLDTAMTLECEHYRGPLLPKDLSAKSFYQDGRVRRVLNNVNNSLNLAAGGEDRVSYNVLAPQLPNNEIYVIDALIHPSSIGSALWNLNFSKDRNLYVAVLVHLPEHFCNLGKNLIGSQAMRIRHFRKLGLKVVTLEYKTLAKLKVHPVELQNYIKERFSKSESSY